MIQQHTIARPASLTGVGLHTGEPVTLGLKPGAAGQGVRFVRMDVADRDAMILANALNVTTTQLGTNIANEAGVSVATVEHFLAACSGMGIDNVIAELDGPELPILDGSSGPFVELLQRAGMAEQAAPKRVLRILKTVEARDGAKFARLSPGNNFEMVVTIDYATQVIGRQTVRFTMTPGAFARDVAFARTFGFASDLDMLRSKGLARGATLDSVVGIENDAVMNEGGLKVPDEFVRHKLLDVIGDLFLAGGPIQGLYEGEQPGHALNNRLLRAVFADPASFAWT